MSGLSMMRTLVAIPVYNEAKHVASVLERVLPIHPEVLVIDDGSTDGTPHILPRFPVNVLRHARNAGYGRSTIDAFKFALSHGYDWIITMDCDDQHEPAAIPFFIEAARREARHGSRGRDVISGSRYLAPLPPDQRPPEERRRINRALTDEINQRLGASLGTLLTDAFCGFKAYRVAALAPLQLDADGYAFPMQFWVQAAAHGLRVRELPVKLIYNDLSRTFGPVLSNAGVRLAHYRKVLRDEVLRWADSLPVHAKVDLIAPEISGASCACRCSP
jgi:dolichol-phosphate mannosyltransferase